MIPGDLPAQPLPGHPGVRSSGQTVRVDGGHRAMSTTALDEAQAFATKSGQHLWFATTMHALSPDALDRSKTEPLLFDAESLMATAIGCYVCETPWSPELTRRRCPGEPKGGRR